MSKLQLYLSAVAFSCLTLMLELVASFFSALFNVSPVHIAASAICLCAIFLFEIDRFNNHGKLMSVISIFMICLSVLLYIVGRDGILDRNEGYILPASFVFVLFYVATSGYLLFNNKKEGG